ncbi:3-dehydroquinate synthase [Peptoanaerobacter stomatis]|uniref:3-dehydroquinate synthase n=1 Tax=Peptoanaerobacter stomatis TaxID=796937 RepID=V9HVM2_9FIRM|nr:3-dehydroquinate synthase [Peptoanaerobacter stomatis]EHL18150.1 3-dehydroquinate synthase [Peptoanaerobacter stomatis]
MKNIDDFIEVAVNTGDEYKVMIGNDLLNKTGEILSALGFKKIAIITDNKVWSIYKEELAKSLKCLNIHYEVLIFLHGENSKSVQNYLKGIDFLAENNYRRSDALLAFGGGVIGDLGGFISATYQRGMQFVQLPTTLLAGVDSSVGGKTAINLKQGKNLLGAFKQPKKVICDLSLYKTMDKKYFLDGVAETIKYSILSSKEMFYELLSPIKQDDLRLEYLVKRCVEYKAKIVALDEQDNDIRRLLNLGHTIGHSIEKLSNYSITHGFAVAIGICYIAKLSYVLNLITKETAKDIVNCIEKNDLPISTNFTPEEIFQNSILDKKCEDDTITVILIQDIGSCVLKKISLLKWKQYIKSAMEANLD